MLLVSTTTPDTGCAPIVKDPFGVIITPWNFGEELCVMFSSTTLQMSLLVILMRREVSQGPGANAGGSLEQLEAAVREKMR